MKLRKLHFILLAAILCMPLMLFNSCQTSDEIIIHQEKLFTKDSEIVSLFLKSVGANVDADFNKSFVNEDQCTEFVYPMTFYAYTNDADEPSPVVIGNDDELVAFLTSLTSGQEFFIMYPVTLIDIDGKETEITDYPDLEGVLTMLVDACQRDSDDDDSDHEGSGNDNHEEIEYEYCGNKNKKVVICHKGNSICISINAIWGHMAHHSEDYLGSCNN